MHLQAIVIKERLLGAEDYEVSLSVGHLASLYNYDMGKFDEAEALYIRSINLGRCFICTWLEVSLKILNSGIRNNTELGREYLYYCILPPFIIMIWGNMTRLKLYITLVCVSFVHG